MAVLWRLYAEKLGASSAQSFIGNYGEIFYDPATLTLRISDGVTPGGKLIVGGASNNPTAADVNVAPTGDISSSTVQSALAELDAEKLALTGGTMAGELLLDGSTPTSNNAAVSKGYVSTYVESFIANGNIISSDIAFDNSTSTLSALTVQDALAELDLKKLDSTGGTVTGHILTTQTSFTDPNQLVSKSYVDTLLSTSDTYINTAGFDSGTGILTLINTDGAAVTAPLDGRYLRLSGGTLTGPLYGPFAEFANLSVTDTLTVETMTVNNFTADNITVTNSLTANTITTNEITTNNATINNQLTANTIVTESITSNNSTFNNTTINNSLTANTVTTNNATINNQLTANTIVTENITSNNSTFNNTTINNQLTANAIVTETIAANSASFTDITVSNTIVINGDMVVNGTLTSNNVIMALGDLTDANTDGSVSGQVLGYNGTEWVATTLPPGTTDTFVTSGLFDMTDGNLTLTRNDGNTAVVNLDGRYLPLSGGTLTGELILNGSTPTNAASAVSASYLETYVANTIASGGIAGNTVVFDSSSVTISANTVQEAITIISNDLDTAEANITALQTQVANLHINDLVDVNANPANGDVLTWDGTQWSSATGTATVNVGDLADLDDTFVVPGYSIVYTSLGWRVYPAVGLAPVMNDEAQFNSYYGQLKIASGPAAGKFNDGSLYFDEALNKLRIWDLNNNVYKEINATNALNDLTDVNAAPAAGEVLTWDATNSEWVAQALPPGTTDTYTASGVIDSAGVITFTKSDLTTWTTDISSYVPTELGQLSDVNANISTGFTQDLESMVWDQTNSEWKRGWVSIASTTATSLNTDYGIMLTGSTAGASTLNIDGDQSLLWNPSTNTLTINGETINSTKIASWDAAAATTETLTSLSINANVLTYKDENGANTDIDLSLYLDDTNLARIVSGTVDSLGIGTFTRDDSTTFTVDFSTLLDTDTDNVAALTDTNITSPTSGQVLTWDGAQWVNQTLPAGTADTFVASGTANTSGFINFNRNDGNTFAVDIKESLGLGDLNDVFDGVSQFGQSGQGLLWDSTNSRWIYGWTSILNVSSDPGGEISLVAAGSTPGARTVYTTEGDLTWTGSSNTLTVAGQTVTPAKIIQWDAAASSSELYTNTAASDTNGLITFTRNDLSTYTVDLQPIFVNVAGDTMTGSLILAADPTANLEAATKQYVDNAGYTLTFDIAAPNTATSLTGDFWYNTEVGNTGMWAFDGTSWLETWQSGGAGGGFFSDTGTTGAARDVQVQTFDTSVASPVYPSPTTRGDGSTLVPGDLMYVDTVNGATDQDDYAGYSVWNGSTWDRIVTTLAAPGVGYWRAPTTTSMETGMIVPAGSAYYATDINAIRAYNGSTWFTVGGGDVTSSVSTSSPNQLIAMFDGNTGKIIKQSNFYQGAFGEFQTSGIVNLGGYVGKYVAQTHTVAGTATINYTTANYYKLDVQAAVSISLVDTFGTAAAAWGNRVGSTTIELVMNGGSVTWPASVKWPGGTAPTLTDSKTHLVMLSTTDGGSNWLASFLTDY